VNIWEVYVSYDLKAYVHYSEKQFIYIYIYNKERVGVSKLLTACEPYRFLLEQLFSVSHLRRGTVFSCADVHESYHTESVTL